MREKLTNENINRACEKAGEFLEAHRGAAKETLRVKLSMEEILMTYQGAFGSGAEFVLETAGRPGSNKLRLTIPGESLDPFAPAGYTSDEDVFIRDALNQMGQLPRWRYRRGANEITLTASKKKLPDWERLVIAIAAAVACGLLVRLLPAEMGEIIEEGVVGPLIDTFLGFLNAVAGPMIFLSVVWGIYSIGDAATFSEIGKKLSIRSAVYLCATALITAAVTMPLFTLSSGSVQTGGDFSALYQMVLDIIPSNLFTPFSRGNTLQILFVAVVVGVAMLLIGKDTQSVAQLSEQLGFIVNGIMNVVSSLVPVFVFGSIFNIVAASDLRVLAAGGKFFAVSLSGCLLVLILHTAACCVKCRMSPVDLWKKLMSTFIISITTASSSAAFADNLHTCKEKLGIGERLANFGVPFGQILYKPGVVVLFWAAALSSAESAGTETSPAWLVMALLMCIVIATAAPPVPGGMSASFTILFAQLGLPADNIAVIIALTSLLDFIVTATNLPSWQCLLKITSDDLER